MKTLRGYIDGRKENLKWLIKAFNLDIDIHRLEEINQLDDFIKKEIIVD